MFMFDQFLSVKNVLNIGSTGLQHIRKLYHFQPNIKMNNPVYFFIYAKCISSIHFSLFGQSDEKRKNQLSCLFTFFILTDIFFLIEQ